MRLRGVLLRGAAGVLLAALWIAGGGCHRAEVVAPELACLEGMNTLAAIVTAEASYHLQHGRYAGISRYGDFDNTLNLSLNHVDDRWTLLVADATDTGYVATLTGLANTGAAGMLGRWVQGPRTGVLSWTGGGCDYQAPGPFCGPADGVLGSIQTAEGAYFQRTGTCLNITTEAGFANTLQVDVVDFVPWWILQVTGATDSGYVATAVGRRSTEFEGRVATLRYTRSGGAVLDCR